MKKIKCKIISKEPTELILENLEKVTIENQPFFKPINIIFLERIKSDRFQLITFHAPPMEFNFFVDSSGIEFEYQKNSLSKDIKGLTLAFAIPLLIGLWIWGLFYKDVELLGKFYLTLLLILPFGLYKIFNFLYKKFILPKDEIFIRKLENILNIEIEKCIS